MRGWNALAKLGVWAALWIGATPSHAATNLFGVSGAGSGDGGGVGTPSFLYRLDSVTGAMVDSIGPVGFTHCTGLRFHPTTGELWGVTSLDGGCAGEGSVLLRIDPETGAGTSVGDVGGNVPDITFHSDGTLYGWFECDLANVDFDDLHTIDLGTGGHTRVGEGGMTTAQTGLAFDALGTLYVKRSFQLFTVDRTTGLMTLFRELLSGTRNALAFDESNRGFTLDSDRNLATIDVISGEVVTVGSLEGRTIAAIAFDLNPPTGTLSGVATVGQIATVTANLADNVGVLGATLRYRRGGDATFQSTPMSETPPGSGTFTATIPAAQVTARGIQYFVEATDGGVPASIGGSAGNPGNLAVSIPAQTIASLAAQTYALAGVSLQANDTSPPAVFDELGAYNTSRWRYGTFDPVGNAYSEPPNARPAVPGQGFWIISREARSVAASGTSTSLGGNFGIALRPGFNQIANPFAFPVAATDVILPAEVEANFIGWNGTAYVSSQAVLQPNTGYWIKNNAAADRVIQVRPIAAGTIAHDLARRDAEPGDVQGTFAVRVHAQAGDFRDDESLFGTRASATDERDAFDFSDPPLPPSGYVDVSFESGNGEHLTVDLRRPGSGARWSLVLRSDRMGESFRVEFDVEQDLPAGWSLVALEGKGAVEVDLAGGSALEGNVGGIPRNWTIIAGPSSFVSEVRDEIRAEITAFAVTEPFPNPIRSGQGVAIDLEIPASGHVRADIFDVTGRHVANLMDGVLARGQHRVAWTARDKNERAVAAGVYFAKVVSDEGSATKKIVLLP